MKAPITVLIIAGLAVAGCNAPGSTARREPAVRPGFIVLTPEQAEQRGIHLEPNMRPPEGANALDDSAVVAPPGTKVYTINRAVDPNDRDVLHEEHVIYRRETTPAWRLQPPAKQKLLIGPRVVDGRQELQPMLDKELASYLADQRRATEANQKAIAALFQAVDSLARQQQTTTRDRATTATEERTRIEREASQQDASER